MSQFKQLQRLIDILVQLRDPKEGCPWDLAQDFKSLVPFTLEETYELAEAIENNDNPETIKELGDLLFHIIFYAQIGKEKKSFDLETIAESVSDKMVFRHPHIFSDHQYANEEEFEKDWLRRKQQEKQASLKENQTLAQSLMGGVSSSLPAMTRAIKLQKKAKHIGFDWDNTQDVFAKLKQEITELEEQLEKPSHDDDKIKDELGDILFSCVNLTRHLKMDPEAVLRQANHKFSQHFKRMEQQLDFDHEKMQEMSISELQAQWQLSKKDH
jgi:ATP diphosphatase